MPKCGAYFNLKLCFCGPVFVVTEALATPVSPDTAEPAANPVTALLLFIFILLVFMGFKYARRGDGQSSYKSLAFSSWSAAKYSCGFFPDNSLHSRLQWIWSS